MSFLKGAVWGKEFLIYLAFVVIFSIVAFRSKPGVIQFYLHQLNKENFGTGIATVNAQQDVFDWLKNSFVPLAYPEFNYDGTALVNYTRMYISGEGRVLGMYMCSHSHAIDLPPHSYLVQHKDISYIHLIYVHLLCLSPSRESRVLHSHSPSQTSHYLRTISSRLLPFIHTGAHRIRQVRSKPKQCNVPERMKKVLGVTVNCTTDYSTRNKLTQEVINPRSPDYRILNETANFTLPFMYQVRLSNKHL